ncbi:MAG: preprotein translocase subunit SecA [Clostridium sp.]
MFLFNYNARELKALDKIVEEILLLDNDMKKLSDAELASKTTHFKELLKKGNTLDSILVEVFAVVREVSYRTIGMKQYPVQLIGGIVLHQGRIAEMKTGEGKTLTEVAPAYLNALSGNGVHIITVNDYLAVRDMELMKPVFDFLGVNVGVVTTKLTQDQRRENYSKDITYAVNTEVGFDFLRDHLAKRPENKVQRGLNFAIVDEVDSILIDIARTPLIISKPKENIVEQYLNVDKFVKTLELDEQYYEDEKLRGAYLTEDGVKKAEEYFNVENYAEVENLELHHLVMQSLKANYVMKLDKDYVVKDGKVLIVDEATGRIAFGTRFSEGLHQAIEAKENVAIRPESQVIATITYQNFFRGYSKLSGMTGTAKTEENEFREIYGLDVIVIPTNKPIKRIDHNDKVYFTEKIKLKNVVEEINESYKIKQPVLIGTPSVEKSEQLSEMLKQEKIPHNLLNAKYHEKEAEIISKAGELGTITVATNMAGRGTDIKLGEGVEEVGGLKVIGTERAESRRIDNQLIGRAGRQGDPGESIFYLSLEDDLLRLFGSDRIVEILSQQGFNEEDVLQNRFISKQVTNSQRKREGINFNNRKNTIIYDDVINQQRKIIYEQRQEVLDADSIEKYVQGMIEETIKNLVETEVDNENVEGGLKELHQHLMVEYFGDENEISRSERVKILAIEKLGKLSAKEAITTYLVDLALGKYKEKKILIGEGFNKVEKKLLLDIIDDLWIKHVDNMVELEKQCINISFKGADPVMEYTIKGGELFNILVEDIRATMCKAILNLHIERSEE